MVEPLRDGFGIANNCDPATVDYFVKIFGYQESLELSNIDRPTSNYIDQEKIQIALNDAAVLINNFIETAPPQGKILIAGSYRRTQATLARCYLDTLRPRQHVIDACEKALQQLDLWASKSQPTAALKFQEAQRYWGTCSGFVKSSYSRTRKFTDPSMLQWEKLFGSNNRRNTLVDIQATELHQETLAQDFDCGGRNAEVISPIMEIVDNLELARGLGNFADTQDVANPQGDALVTGMPPEDPEDPVPGTFQANLLIEDDEEF